MATIDVLSYQDETTVARLPSHVLIPHTPDPTRPHILSLTSWASGSAYSRVRHGSGWTMAAFSSKVTPINFANPETLYP